ncbi:CcmD family protein [Larkinella terrae]|uniref:CcmD family protein n=1 Tax=Larkinella terrae TaxID=2025311 RepID=A0A7K0EJK2_9BACT|nr:CcmD family protein [Larkinella terrae]MRS62040.1 CcmD family protein [Larkinella terrae]
MIHKLLALCFLLLLSFSTQAQDVEMADRLRADGKIWVVVAVILVTFAGVVLYLIRLDSKISKLEKEIK